MEHTLSFPIIIIMAAHKRRESSFYASINGIYNVDMLPVARKRKIKGRGRMWEVERLTPKKVQR